MKGGGQTSSYRADEWQEPPLGAVGRRYLKEFRSEGDGGMEWLIAATGPLLVGALHGGEERVGLAQDSREAKASDRIFRRNYPTTLGHPNSYAAHLDQSTR